MQGASCIAMNKLLVKAWLHTQGLKVSDSTNLHLILKFITGLSVWSWIQKRNWKAFLSLYIISVLYISLKIYIYLSNAL